MKLPPQDCIASKRHTGALQSEPMFLTTKQGHFLGRIREQGTRLEEPRGSELEGGAKWLTCRVMSHSFCQHGLPTARWAIHEDPSGRVDADLKQRGG